MWSRNECYDYFLMPKSYGPSDCADNVFQPSELHNILLVDGMCYSIYVMKYDCMCLCISKTIQHLIT